jgi:hypothetical protein
LPDYGICFGPFIKNLDVLREDFTKERVAEEMLALIQTEVVKHGMKLFNPGYLLGFFPSEQLFIILVINRKFSRFDHFGVDEEAEVDFKISPDVQRLVGEFLGDIVG